MTIDREQVEHALPNYEIGEEIGRGGWGVVLHGRHRQLGREVAIKELPRAFAADPGVQRRFASEARLLATLDHPHIVPIYDYVESAGLCLLVMELLPGGTVWQRFNREGITAEAACSIVIAACSALHYAHGKGVLHRDIKPDNILFTAAGTIKVSDFGIAKVVGGQESLATRTGEVLGTPAYMAPEQALGEELTPATDIYALGTVLYELLSGHLPFASDGNSIAVLYRHVHEPPVPLGRVAPEVSDALQDVTMRALATDVADRYESAEEFGVAVADAATTALGRGWLQRGGVPVMASGQIGARISGGAPPVAATSEPSAAAAPVRRAEVAESAPATVFETAPERAGAGGRSLLPDELVPVAEVVAAAEPLPPPVPALVPPISTRRRRWPLIIAAVVIVAAVVVGVVITVGGRGSSSKPGATSSGRRNPAVIATIPLGTRGDHVAFVDGALYVSEPDANRLARIDPNGNRVVPAATFPSTPHSIAADGANLFVSASNAPTVFRTQAAATSASVTVTPIDLPRKLNEIAFGDQALWGTDGTLLQIDPAVDKVVASIPAGASLDSVVAGNGDVWVANRQSGTVTRVDAGTGKVTATIRVGVTPEQLALGAGSVWVANSGGTVSRIDPATNTVTATISTGRHPVWVVVGFGSVWVTDSGGDRLLRIDPATNRVVASVQIGRNPESAAIGAGSVWVVNRGDQSLSRVDPGS